MFVLTYVAIVSATTLIRMERGWTVTAILSVGLIASPVLNWLVVPRAAAAVGPGGAGAGAAMVLVLLEVLMTTVMTALVWRRVFDGRVARMLAKTAGVCIAVILLDRLLASAGALRLVADVVAYGVLAVAVKAVDIPEIVRFVRSAAAQRGEGHAGAL
jgi:hypothetical protein